MQPPIQIEAICPQGYLNLISQIMKDMRIPQTIDTKVPYDAQYNVSPGDVVQMIVMDILTGRQALVHMADWAKRLDLEKLLCPDVQASFFNDDALARHLDRISEAEVHELYSTLALQAWQYNPDSILAFHSDTTSKSVYGAYPATNEEDLFITEGYSRDRQGDKQFQYGLVVDGQGRPIYGDVHDGNTSDKTWNPDVLKKLEAQLQNGEFARLYLRCRFRRYDARNAGAGQGSQGLPHHARRQQPEDGQRSAGASGPARRCMVSSASVRLGQNERTVPSATISRGLRGACGAVNGRGIERPG